MDFNNFYIDFGGITTDVKINSFLNNAFNELGLGFLKDMWSSQKDYIEKLIEKVCCLSKNKKKNCYKFYIKYFFSYFLGS